MMQTISSLLGARARKDKEIESSRLEGERNKPPETMHVSSLYKDRKEIGKTIMSSLACDTMLTI